MPIERPLERWFFSLFPFPVKYLYSFPSYSLLCFKLCFLFSSTISQVTCLITSSLLSSNPIQFSSVQLLSHEQLCDPMDYSMPGCPVHHQLPEPTQTHVHQVSDAIQPSHPLSSPFPPAFNLSQHQGLFKWVSSSHQVAKILEFQLPISEFLKIPMNFQDWFPLGWTSGISLQSKGLSRAFSNTTVQKHQFFGTQLSLQILLQYP